MELKESGAHHDKGSLVCVWSLPQTSALADGKTLTPQRRLWLPEPPLRRFLWSDTKKILWICPERVWFVSCVQIPENAFSPRQTSGSATWLQALSYVLQAPSRQPRGSPTQRSDRRAREKCGFSRLLFYCTDWSVHRIPSVHLRMWVFFFYCII